MGIKIRLEWVLRYGHVKVLGTWRDFDYSPITLEIIDGAIAREKAKETEAIPDGN